jgi:hypothetical protein
MVLELTERRLLCSNERKREMGLEEWDVDQVIRKLKVSYQRPVLDDDEN